MSLTPICIATPDSLASGPSLPLAQDEPSADAPGPEPVQPVPRVGSAKSKTTRLRFSPGTSQADQPFQEAALVKQRTVNKEHPEASSSSSPKAVPDAPNTAVETKKSKSKKVKEVGREVAGTQEVTVHAGTLPKPHKKHAKAVDRAEAQPTTTAAAAKPTAADEPLVSVLIKDKKSKKKRKDVEGVEDVDAAASKPALEADDTSSVPAKAEKKSKKKRKNESEQEETDAQTAAQPDIDASEASEKRKSKKKRKQEDAPGEPVVEATPKAAPEPAAVVDAATAASTGDKKGKKRKKEAGAVSAKPADAASAPPAPATFDTAKAVADAVAAIRARHSKSVKEARNDSHPKTSQSAQGQCDAFSIFPSLKALAELSPDAVAGPSSVSVDTSAKGEEEPKFAPLTSLNGRLYREA